ncbi:hypothetical protein ABE402_00175 [Bacillus smithii]
MMAISPNSIVPIQLSQRGTGVLRTVRGNQVKFSIVNAPRKPFLP